MKTIWYLLLQLTIIPCLPGSKTARFEAFRPANSQTEPKDIRDIFLTVPSPANLDDLFADPFTLPSARKGLFDRTNFSAGASILDIPNGYIKVDLVKKGEGSAADRHGYIVVTSFRKSNRDRLVVLQFVNLTDGPDTLVYNYYYVLSGGAYSEVSASKVLPSIKFFDDFWGGQPEPDPAVREYVKSMSDASFYEIEWPRRGTAAKAISRVPYSDTDTEEMNRIQKVLGKAQFKAIALVWDKERGVFSKGARTR